MPKANKNVNFGYYSGWMITKNTWALNFMGGSQYIYLLEGEEKAMLIDTGYGQGDLRAYVEKLTDKPVTVVNTHFHVDHYGGNAEWEKVYVADNWEKDASEGYQENDKQFAYPDYEKIVIGDGFTFDLGGRVIKTMRAKIAHCNSSLFFYDETFNLLFSGDEFESGQTLMYLVEDVDLAARLKNMKENAERLYALCNEHTLVLPNHNGAPVAREYFLDYEGLVDAVFTGTAEIEDDLNHKYIDNMPGHERLCRVRFGGASIFAVKEDVLKAAEKE
ncbi:MAG: MBL fold metallo-hydrolase [Lachnospiraceae bacterium]|nr:MBL fold metallo-hydrolase [Lachnospiraceae bacterium]